MNNRTFGRTDRLVSEIGLGGHREGVEAHAGVATSARFFLPAQERASVVGRAIDGGVTYFDTTFGCELASLGESLRILSRRDGMFVSGMRVDFFANLLTDDADPRSYTRREVEGRLEDFGFDHMEQFLLGALDSGDPLANASMMDDVFDELGRLRDEGKISHIGFSCHSPDYAARLLDAWPQFDAAMTPYNFANRTAEGTLADALKKTGAAWIAMKPLVWAAYGLPVTVLRNIRPVAGRLEWDADVAIAALSLRFILANPLITTTVPAINTIRGVDENLRASGCAELTAEDVEHLTAYGQAMAAEKMVPLAIGGLLTDNLRVRTCAIGVLCGALDIECEQIDYQADDAEARAAEVAKSLLAGLAADPAWSAFVPDSSV